MNIKYEKKNVYETLSKASIDDMYNYAKEYIDFLNFAKTEYKCVEFFKSELDEIGFINLETLEEGARLSPGDKVYYINKERSMFISVIGEESIKNGINIIGAHIDSPRLDTKPMPLFERDGLALMKTQYYGGIKKYQWLTIPLSMYGVIYTSTGEKLDVVVGTEEDDFTFTITDLLPHLSKEEMEKKASDFVDPENLAIVVGSLPDSDEKDNKIKTSILRILNKKYGIKEIDFARSDIRFVPSFKAKYVGFDKGLIAGYGQDDKVCAYAAVTTLINIAKENKKLSKTIVALIVDKEEIGSLGNTSMNSDAFDLFLSIIAEKTENESLNNTYILRTYNNSKMLSADVTAAIDPLFENLSDVQNGSIIGSGIALDKYTGAGGKSGSSEASAKYMAYIMDIFEKNNVMYQIGTLGKIGKGGGGTIAYILANKGMEVVDCGTAVLSMHSPYEITSVADVYMTYRAYKAFYLG